MKRKTSKNKFFVFAKMNLMESAEGLDTSLIGKPQYEVNGRSIFFGEPGTEKFSQGIELDIPISPDLRDKLRNSDAKIELPDNIKRIKFLELANEESMLDPIISKGPDVNNVVKDSAISDRSGMLTSILLSILRNETQNNVGDFNNALKKGKGESLVIIHGHGDNLGYVGESTANEYLNSEGQQIGATGNKVHLSKVLNRYNDPNLYSAIILKACNEKGLIARPREVPVFYARSITRLAGTDKIAKTLPLSNKDLWHFLRWYVQSRREVFSDFRASKVVGASSINFDRKTDAS